MATDGSSTSPLSLFAKMQQDKDNSEYLNMQQKLEEVDIPAHNWKPADLPQSFLTKKMVSKAAKIITSIDNIKRRKAVMELITWKGTIVTFGDCLPRDMYKFCMWLRSSEGQAKMRDVMYAFKMEAKKLPNATVAESVALSVFNQMFTDKTNELKSLRATAEIDIVHWQRKIVNRQAELGEDLKSVRATAEIDIEHWQRKIALRRAELEEELISCEDKFQPTGSYKTLDELEINKRCWPLYLQWHIDQKKEVPTLDKGTQEDAKGTFAEKVKQADRLDHLRKEGNLALVQRYVRLSIQQFTELNDAKKVDSFRRTLAILGGNMALEETTQDQTEANRTDTDGKGPVIITKSGDANLRSCNTRKKPDDPDAKRTKTTGGWKDKNK